MHPQDRITKQRIYAAAGIAEYWVVNLRNDCVEILREPDPRARAFRVRRLAGPGERIDLVAFSDASVLVSDLLPRRAE